MKVQNQTSPADQQVGHERATTNRATRSVAASGRLQRLLDFCLVVLVLIATILVATGYDDQPLIEYSPTSLPLRAILIFAFSSAVLLWRRQFPVLVLWAVLLASGVAIFFEYFEGPLVAVLVGLFCVGRNVERSDHSIIALVITLGFVTATSLGEQASSGILWTIVLLLSVVLVWYVGRFVRVRDENKILVQDQAYQEQTRREIEAKQAVAQERTRIARDLHDIVAHHVSLMTVQAAAARTVADKDFPRAIEAMGAVEQVGREALNELRHLLGVLRLENEDDALGPQPGLVDVPRLVTQMRDAGIRIDFQIEGDPKSLSKGTDLAAFRIIQEALTNVLKHAGPKQRPKLK